MREPIRSRSNPLFRKLRRLDSEPRERRRESLFLLWGARLVQEAMDSPTQVAHLILGESVAAQASLRPLVRGAMQAAIPVAVFSDGLLEELAAGSADQGLLALVRIPSQDPGTLLRGVPSPLLLVADRIRDPGNLGTLVRLAEAGGARAMVILPGTADPYHTRAARSSAGSILRVPLLFPVSREAWDALARQTGLRSVVTLSRGGTAPDRTDLKGPLALIVGNEGEGVSQDWIEAADARVTIRLGGSVESLNVAAAAAVLLYEAYLQRGGRGS